ncbi:MAG: M20/M25/M40 family metallo-hydrolase [Acidobacteria bacterium]|nr:M20/M25/M40 family metallo-hydrolase [Acidobacteriota bacterium]
MARSLLLIIVVAALATAAFPGAQTPAPAAASTSYVNRGQLMRDMGTLSSPAFEGRGPGTPGGLKAREWIVGEFRTAGLSAAGTDNFLQPFVLAGSVPSPPPGDATGAPGPMAANVVGRIPGRGATRKLLVVTAHYDHLGLRNGVLYPGADDNASGVAALLAAARYFVRNPPRHPMVFVAFDAEEIGLRGARAFVSSRLVAPGEIGLAVNLDMVSRGSANEIFAAGTAYSPWLTPLLEEVQSRSAVTIRMGHDRPEASAGGLEDWTHLSDHGVFHDAGVPFVYFGVEDHPDNHEPTDTVERINPRFFGDVADMIVEALRTFDEHVN